MTKKKVIYDPWPAVAYQAKEVQLIAAGGGGIGGWVIPHLAWLVWSFNRTWNRAIEPRHASLTIVDFDRVEAKNVESGQHFCPPEIGAYKAEVLYQRAKLAYRMRNDEIEVRVEPFSPAMVTQHNPEVLTILIGCVDSSEGREALARCVDASYASGGRVWWINANNEDTWGQVYCGNTARLRDLKGCLHGQVCSRLPSPALIAPSLIEHDPPVATTRPYSCGEMTGVEQSHAIHMTMAAFVYGYVELLLKGLPIFSFASYVTLRSGFSTGSELITPPALCRALGRSDACASFFTMDPKEPVARKLEVLLTQ